MSTQGATPKRRNSAIAPLTARQAELICAVRTLSNRNRMSPSRDELAKALGVSASTAADLTRSAIAKGYLTKTPGKYRSLLLTAAGMTIKIA